MVVEGHFHRQIPSIPISKNDLWVVEVSTRNKACEGPIVVVDIAWRDLETC